MIGDLLGTILGTVTKELCGNNDQPRVEVVEKPVYIPQQQSPQTTQSPINFNLTINIISGHGSRNDLPAIETRGDKVEIDLK